jgi:hypothetical protein
LVKVLFSTPIITPVKLSSLLGMHYTTASRYLKELHQKGFLQNTKVGKYQLYINKRLIDVLNTDFSIMIYGEDLAIQTGNLSTQVKE